MKRDWRLTLLVMALWVCCLLPTSLAFKRKKYSDQQEEEEECKPSVTAKHEMVESECLATDLDFSEYHCMPSGPLEIECVNEHKDCQGWANRGECNKNPQYMLLDCRKACNTCIPLHGLSDYNVPQIAPEHDSRQDVLQRLRDTQVYIHKTATKSVDALKTCRNLSSMCTYWSLVGQCERNPTYMHKECSAACRAC